MTYRERRAAEGEENRNQILRYLLGKDPGQWPSSIREIGVAVGLASTSTVYAHLVALEAEGLVEHSGRYGYRAVRKAAA